MPTPSRLITQAANRAAHQAALSFELELRLAVLERAVLALSEGASEATVLERIPSYARMLARAGVQTDEV